MYTALVIIITVLGVPAALWLTKLIYPPKREEEAIHRAVEEARRQGRRHIDRMPP